MPLCVAVTAVRAAPPDSAVVDVVTVVVVFCLFSIVGY
jgi:hypothetical protein